MVRSVMLALLWVILMVGVHLALMAPHRQTPSPAVCPVQETGLYPARWRASPWPRLLVSPSSRTSNHSPPRCVGIDDQAGRGER